MEIRQKARDSSKASLVIGRIFTEAYRYNGFLRTSSASNETSMSQACLAYIDRARITRHTRCSNQLKKERKISKEGKKDIANRKKKEHVISTVTRAERTRIAELDIMPKSSVTSYRRNAKGRSMQEEEKGCTVKVRR